MKYRLSFSREEKETIIRSDDASGKWEIYTIQSKIINRLKRVGLHPNKVDKYGGAYYYDVDFNRISFRKESKGRKMTEEQRQKAAERLGRRRSIKN